MVKAKPTGKLLKKVSRKGKNLNQSKKKSASVFPENEPASPVCYAGKEKFREGFEDLMSGKTSHTRE